MAAITICSDFGVPKKKSTTVSTVSPSDLHEVICILFIYIPLIISDAEHFFHMLFGHLYVFFGEMSVCFVYMYKGTLKVYTRNY